MNALLMVAMAILAGTAQDPGKKDAKLDGKWKAVRIVYNGKDYSSKLDLKFHFKGNQFSVLGDDEVKKDYGKFSFKLDPSTKPRCIDLKVTLGLQKDAAMEGIYQLKDGKCMICIQVFGNERPARFTSEEGSSVALVVLERAE